MTSALLPRFYLLATAIVVFTSYYIFARYAIDPRFHFTVIAALAVFYAAMNFARQLRGPGQFNIRFDGTLAPLFNRALTRYLVWLAIIYSGFSLLRMIPIYKSDMAATLHRLFDDLMLVYLVLGLPYFLLTLLCKASRVEDFYDPVVRLLHMLKQPLVRVMRGDNLRSITHVFRNRYNRKVLLNLLMRVYFLPIMLLQLAVYFPYALNLHDATFNGQNLLAALYWITAMLWLLDMTNAALAYLIESRWLENRSRSIDMSVTGWVVCLVCYEPFSNFTGAVFPFAPLLATGDVNALLVPTSDFLVALKIIEILLLGLHIYVDVSLGTSVANITLKQLQTRGAYGLIRHPGTTTKLLLWFVVACGYSQFWTLTFLFGYCAWAALYIARALTEERHLSGYAEYRAYREKVRYRFIPGVV